MLGKLLKYEIKATARLFLPMYITILIFAVINKIFDPFNTLDSSSSFNLQTILGAVSSILYFALIVGILVMTLVIMIQRFYKNLLGDEGYLMFTLPVKSWEHIISKLAVAMMWTIISLLIIIFSIIILIGIDVVFAELPRLIDTFLDSFGYRILLTIAYYAILELIGGILMIYCAISLGHLFPKHKLIASFGMYCALYFINQIVGLVLLLLFGRDFIASVVATGAPTPAQVNTFLLSLSPSPILLSIGYFVITNFILNKHLNLE